MLKKAKKLQDFSFNMEEILLGIQDKTQDNMM